ncbi:MAG: tetratricopeptide repeat protein [Chloroflexota bacterium]
MSTKTSSLRLIANRYEVVNRFEGGMGLVYFCRDHQTNDLVGLKTFKPEYLPNRAARDLFLREGTTWVELGQHPNIVRAHRVERVGDGREVYLVLEWIVEPEGKPNPSLRTWLRPGRPLSLEHTLGFALDIARGMRHAVAKIPGFVHRDLKPENVLVGHDHVARVTDFGLARTLSGYSSSTAGKLPQPPGNFVRTRLTHGLAGTPLYMSPEQWLKQPLDERADIYALGCILYEMINGRFAAVADTVEAVRAIHLSGRVPPPPRSTPRDLLLLLSRCLATEPASRFHTWEQVVQAIETVYRRLLGKAPPVEETAVSPTKTPTPDVQLAMARSYNTMGLSYLDIGKPAVAILYFEQAIWISRQEEEQALETAAVGNLGTAYRIQGYFDRALEFYQEQLSIAWAIENHAEIANALGNLGTVYHQLGRDDEAVSFHERQLEIAEKLPDPSRKGNAHYSLGNALLALHYSDSATVHYQQALEIARTIRDRGLGRKVMASMGRLYVETGETKNAANVLKNALDQTRKTGDRMTEGEVLRHMGLLYIRIQQPERAIEAYTKALTISEESHDMRREAQDRFQLGRLYRERGEGQKAIEQYEAALLSYQTLRDRGKTLDATDRLADAYQAWGDYMQAATLQRQALMLAQEIEDRTAVQQALFKMGVAYERWGDTERTLRYFQEHLALSRENNDAEAEQTMLDRLGRLEVRRQQYHSAIRYYKMAEVAAQKQQNGVAQALALSRQGDMRLLADMPQEAVELYKTALKMAQTAKDGQSEAVILANLALASYQAGKRWQVNRQMEKALRLSEEIGMETAVFHVKRRLAELLFRQEKWDRAGAYALQAHTFFEANEDTEATDSMAQILETIKKSAKPSRRFPF